MTILHLYAIIARLKKYGSGDKTPIIMSYSKITVLAYSKLLKTACLLSTIALLHACSLNVDKSSTGQGSNFHSGIISGETRSDQSSLQNIKRNKTVLFQSTLFDILTEEPLPSGVPVEIYDEKGKLLYSTKTEFKGIVSWSKQYSYITRTRYDYQKTSICFKITSFYVGMHCRQIGVNPIQNGTEAVVDLGANQIPPKTKEVLGKDATGNLIKFGFHQLHVIDLNSSKFSISTGKPTLLNPILRACLYLKHDDQKIPTDQNFYVTGFSRKNPIAKKTNSNGCIEWQETIRNFQHYSRQRWHKKEIKICADNALTGKGCIDRTVYINPWDYSDSRYENFIWNQGQKLTNHPNPDDIHGSPSFKEFLPIISITKLGFNFISRNFTITKDLDLHSTRKYHISLTPKIQYMTFQGEKIDILNGQYELSYLLEKAHGEGENNIIRYSNDSQEKREILKLDKICFSENINTKKEKNRLACHKHRMIDYSKSPILVESKSDIITSELNFKFTDLRYVMSRNKIYFQITPVDKTIKFQKNTFYGSIRQNTESGFRRLLEKNEMSESVNKIIDYISKNKYSNSTTWLNESNLTYTTGNNEFSTDEINHFLSPKSIQTGKYDGTMEYTRKNYSTLEKACKIIYPKNRKMAKIYAERTRENEIKRYKMIKNIQNEVNKKTLSKYFGIHIDISDSDDYLEKIKEECNPVTFSYYSLGMTPAKKEQMRTKGCKGSWNFIDKFKLINLVTIGDESQTIPKNTEKLLRHIRSESKSLLEKMDDVKTTQEYIAKKVYKINFTIKKSVVNPEKNPINIVELRNLCIENPLEFLSVNYIKQIEKIEDEEKPKAYNRADISNMYSGLFFSKYIYEDNSNQASISTSANLNKTAVISNSSLYNLSMNAGVGVNLRYVNAGAELIRLNEDRSSFRTDVGTGESYADIITSAKGDNENSGVNNSESKTINTESLTFSFKAQTRSCIQILRRNFILTYEDSDKENSNNLFLCKNELNDLAQYTETWFYTYLYFRNQSSAIHDTAGDLTQRPLTSLIRGNAQLYLLKKLKAQPYKVEKINDIITNKTKSIQEIYHYYKLHHNFPGLIETKPLKWSKNPGPLPE